MDKKGKKLLYLLDRNSRETLTSLAKKLKTSKEVVHYRLNKLQEEGYLTKFYTIIDLSKLGYVAYKIYFQFQNLTKEKEKEILDYLVSQDRIFWVATSSGSWDMMIGTWAKNIIDFNENILEEILNKYSQFILNKAITITKYNVQWNRAWFLDDNQKESRVTSKVGGEPIEVELDKKGKEILKIIANNARLQITEIAKKAKITPTVAKYRLKQLKDRKIICSYRISPELKKFNYGFFKSFIYLQNITSEKQKKLINYCKQQKNILNIVTCVGSWDFEIEFEVEDFERFNEIMKKIREKFPDLIKNYESVLISDEPRVDFMPACYPQFKS